MAGAGGGKRRLTGRGVTAAILAVLCAVMAPLGVVSAWAWTQVSDTDRFVATYAPLANAPEVKQLVVSRISAATTKNLGILGGNTVVQGLVTDTVTSVVSSPAFASIWAQTLRSSHRQLRALLADEQGALEIEDNTLQMPLGPYVDALRQRLIAAGVPFADRLPTVTAAVPLVELDPRVVALMRGGYHGLEAMATWLPWLALLCGVAAFLVWPHKRRALVTLGIALGVALVALVAGWSILEPPLLASFAADVRPVVTLFVTTATAPLLSPLLGLAVTTAVLLFTGALTLKSPAAT